MATNRRWTTQEIERAVTLHVKDKLLLVDVARVLGRSYQSVHNLFKRNNLEKLSPQEIKAIRGKKRAAEYLKEAQEKCPSGKVFGGLKVIGLGEVLGRSYQWRVKCTHCGKFTRVRLTRLNQTSGAAPTALPIKRGQIRQIPLKKMPSGLILSVTFTSITGMGPSSLAFQILGKSAKPLQVINRICFVAQR